MLENDVINKKIQESNEDCLYAINSHVNLYDENLEYNTLVKDLLKNDIILKMKNYIQHGNTTCYQHCINVSYYSYKICKKLHLDIKSAARAGLLHDLFLYDWHKDSPKASFFKQHGFIHPKIAYNNAKKYFDINLREKDMILKHMFPLTLKLPKYKETFIIILVDKWCTIKEFINGFYNSWFISNLSLFYLN